MNTGGYVYILTNKNHTTLCTGVTIDLVRRVSEHKEHKLKGFTKRYNVDILVYFEFLGSISLAIEREKIIKSGSRQKKIELINSINPQWEDLYLKIRGL